MLEYLNQLDLFERSISSICIRGASNIYYYIKQVLLVEPLRRLYFDGPDLKSFGIISCGFWNGISKPEICALLTTISEHHWRQHSELCDERIERQFLAFVVTVEFVIYVIMMGYIMKRGFACYFPDELTLEIRALRKWYETKPDQKNIEMLTNVEKRK